MPEPEERPLYGAYATPEEQARRRGSTPSPESHDDVAHDGSGVPERSGRLDPALYMHRAPGTDEPVPARKPPHPADRVITIGLLVYALLTVAIMGSGLLNLGDSLVQAWKVIGIPGEFSNFAAAKSAGIVAYVVLIVGFALTTMYAVRRLRAARPAWWVPLVGGAVTWLIVYICIAVPLLGDPGFVEYATTLSGGGTR